MLVLKCPPKITVADWDSMGRVVTQTRGWAFQTLGQAFGFLLRLQKLSRVFERLGRVFYDKHSAECFVMENLWKSGL